MTVSAQLKAIQKATGLTQTELALELGVTFAALNRWVVGHSAPRPASQEKIDLLYKKEVNQIRANDTDLLAAEKRLLARQSTSGGNPLAAILSSPDLQEECELSLTFHTNSLEGSSMTEHDTALVLFENAALPDKTLVEQLEAKNHQTALRYLFDYLARGNPVNEALILKLHSILMNSIRPDAGQYRVHGVRIVGTFVPTANPLRVPLLMQQFGQKIAGKIPKDIIAFVAQTHAEFEQIHPFSDGNGRIGRLLIQAVLLKSNYPPAVITTQTRRDYMSALNLAQLQQNFTPLEHIMVNAILEGQNILNRKS